MIVGQVFLCTYLKEVIKKAARQSGTACMKYEEKPA